MQMSNDGEECGGQVDGDRRRTPTKENEEEADNPSL